jgi:excisionase family DNA binding protein
VAGQALTRDNMGEDLHELTSPSGVGTSTYHSVAALAADIGLSGRSTRNALRRGEIPHIRVGRRFILPKAAIAEWLRSAGQGTEQTTTPMDQQPKVVACPGPTEVTVMRRSKLAEPA